MASIWADEVGGVSGLAQAKGHVGTGIGQGEGDGATQSARRARDQRGPALQAEVRILSHGCSSRVGGLGSRAEGSRRGDQLRGRGRP